MSNKLLDLESVKASDRRGLVTDLRTLINNEATEVLEVLKKGKAGVLKVLRNRVRAALEERLEHRSDVPKQQIISWAKTAIREASNELINGVNVDHNDSGKGDWSRGQVSDLHNDTGGGRRVIRKWT